MLIPAKMRFRAKNLCVKDGFFGQRNDSFSNIQFYFDRLQILSLMLLLLLLSRAIPLALLLPVSGENLPQSIIYTKSFC